MEQVVESKSQSGENSFSNELDLTKCSVLVVDPENEKRSQLVRDLKELGFPYVSETESHDTGIRRSNTKPFTHVIFSTTSQNVPYHTFLQTIVQNSPETIVLPMTATPNPDQVYEALMLGARGFIVYPCKKEDLHRLFELSAREELALAVELQNLDRNKVLASLVSSGLDDLAQALKKARGKSTKEIQALTEQFKSSASMARNFCQGGDEELLKVISEHMIKQSFKIPTRLGKLRRHIAAKRKTGNGEKKETK
ncbi:MAG: response regulator [bacterium]|nr:response regulator [bacterium]